MNQLIKLSNTTIDADTVQTINARELHAFLEVGKDFSSWMKDRIEQYDFENNKDYLLTKIGEQLPSGMKYKNEYHLTLDMAKELSMVERNEKGKQARQYFIKCERHTKSSQVDPMQVLSDPAAMRGLLLTYSEKVITLENKVDELTPKAEALDRIATNSDGSFCVRDAAKTLQVQEKKFRKFLLEKNWLYRRPMGAGYLAYSDKIKRGLMEHKITRGEKSDGSEWLDTQARITAKGLALLAEFISVNDNKVTPL
ncbi:MAG: phage antirepressor KilAC domain-containing protein [Nitrosomonas sp.]|nr:phage antirepressor KilAC domain-containing protein [Nitrosomonas sp.]